MLLVDLRLVGLVGRLRSILVSYVVAPSGRGRVRRAVAVGGGARGDKGHLVRRRSDPLRADRREAMNFREKNAHTYMPLRNYMTTYCTT